MQNGRPSNARHRSGRALCATLALTLVAAACGSDDESASPGQGGTTASSEPFKIGAILPLTGPLVSSIKPNYSGLRIAVDEINKAGGISGRQVQVVEFDDEYKAANEPAIISRLQSEGIKYVVGPTGSSNVSAALAASTPAKVITHGWAKTDVQGDPSKFPYNFQLVYNVTSEATAHATFLAKRNFKEVAVLSEQTEFGEGSSKVATGELRKSGANLTTVDSFPLTAPDLRPYVQKAKDSGAKAVSIFTVSSTVVTQMVQAMNELQWYPTVTTLVGPWNKKNSSEMPEQFKDKIFATQIKALSYSDTEPISPKVMEYAGKIIAHPESKDAPAGAASANMYDFMYMLKRAIEDTKSFDVDTVKKALETKPFEGMLGTYEMSSSSHSGFGPEDLVLVRVSSLSAEESKGATFAKREG